MTEFKRIPPEQAQALREKGAVVVDIRDPQAYASGHINGAVRLDNQNIQDFIRGADLDAPLVVVCYHGNSSQSAAAYLVSQGVDRARIEAQGRGFDEPLAGISPFSPSQRRVEVLRVE